ncbi:MAG: hypothetical protein MZV63_44760 [Marinilabiliales bacterium]|nr:hypothetical protein [Marinilabiliales bacterium]
MYDVAKTDNGLDIPEANTVLEEFGVKFFFKSNGNIMEQYGTVTANTITKYDKPFVKMVFPFDYGDVYSGDFSGYYRRTKTLNSPLKERIRLKLMLTEH